MARIYSPDGNPAEDLVISEEFPSCVTVDLIPDLIKIQQSLLDAKNEEDRKRFKRFKRNILYINGQDDYLAISPINTLGGHASFLDSKYDKIKRISLVGFKFETPKTIDDVMELLEDLPSGFVKDYAFGLGLLKDYRFVVGAVEEVPDVEEIVISKNAQTGLTEYGFVIGFDDFDAIRRGLNRITQNYQSEARADKAIFAQNSILTKWDAVKYPEVKRPLKKDTIFKLVSSTSCNESTSVADTASIVDLLSMNKKAIHESNRRKVLDLKQDIELVNLEWLISEVEKLLAKKTSEANWQSLLSENPYILSMVFGYPILKVQGQASVGGRTFAGSGDKITDFLVKNEFTDNVALVEIKKPSTPLLRSSEYRSGVFTASSEFAGSISQLLDQRYKFQKEIASVKDNSDVYDIESYSVDCVLIIGVIPDSKAKRKSFELIRHNSRDVRIFTFDELAAKLRELYLLLKPDLISSLNGV